MFQEKLEYALTQCRPPENLDWPASFEIDKFNQIVEEINKLDLLPKEAFKRLYVE